MSEIDEMKNRRIRISKGRTITPKKYEPSRIEISIDGDIPDKSEIDEFVDDLTAYCEGWLDEETEKILKEALED